MNKVKANSGSMQMKGKEFSTILAVTPCVIMFFPMKSFTMPAVKDTGAQGDRDRCLSPQTLVPEPADGSAWRDRGRCLSGAADTRRQSLFTTKHCNPFRQMNMLQLSA